MLDFGQGFYLTSYKDQAQNWARRKALRSGGDPLLNVYEFQDTFDGLKTLVFGDDDEAWVKFVCSCRNGGNDYKQYDLIVDYRSRLAASIDEGRYGLQYLSAGYLVDDLVLNEPGLFDGIEARR